MKHSCKSRRLTYPFRGFNYLRGRCRLAEFFRRRPASGVYRSRLAFPSSRATRAFISGRMLAARARKTRIMKKRDCRQFRQSDIHALRIRRNPQKSVSSFRFVSGVRCDGGSVANFGIVLAAVFHVVLLSQDGMMLLPCDPSWISSRLRGLSMTNRGHPLPCLSL